MVRQKYKSLDARLRDHKSEFKSLQTGEEGKAEIGGEGRIFVDLREGNKLISDQHCGEAEIP